MERGVPVLEARDLLTDNLDVIERAIRFAAHRHRLEPIDAEELGAVVKLRLVENDYAVLRAYEGRSSFRTFISMVVQRMALDYRIHEWGKWHASAEAKRLGEPAVELERILQRDGRTIDEALPLLQSKYEDVTRESLQQLAAKLPPRALRRRSIPLDDAAPETLAHPASADESLLAGDRRRASKEVSEMMSSALARFGEEDQLILQLRFEQGLTVAQIARVLRLDQKLTYRRIERMMREIRRQLERAGITARDVDDLIGRDEIFVRFDFGNPQSRPSISVDETRNKHPEAP
jgi:RNA polymerase sigma factor for flagellar operon FliA